MTGVARVVAYNWPRYAVAVGLVAIASAVAWPLAVIAAAGVAVSLAATWWAYDHSGLYRWDWCLDGMPAPQRYAVLSSGLDELGPELRGRYPSAVATSVDLFDPAVMRQGSIRRARHWNPPAVEAISSTVDELPVPPASLDAVYLAFAAHELRRPAQRRALFAAIARALRPGGRVLLVEHCRDAATILAYGPGAWHFYPRREWLRVAESAGLTLEAETTCTPLVRALRLVG